MVGHSRTSQSATATAFGTPRPKPKRWESREASHKPPHTQQDTQFPKGSTTIRVTVESGTWWALVGQPLPPEEFLQRALQSKRPGLPPALEKLSNGRLADVHRLRCSRLKSMCDLATDLQHQEDQDHASLDPHIHTILKGKRLRLFETLLRGIDVPDQALVEDTRAGFSFTGWLPTRPPKVVPPVMHKGEVWDQRARHNAEIWERCQPSGDPDLDQAL